MFRLQEFRIGFPNSFNFVQFLASFLYIHLSHIGLKYVDFYNYLYIKSNKHY